MKKIVAVLLMLIIPLCFCACEESEQIDELAFVKILGIDKTAEGLKVTAGMLIPKNKDDKEAQGHEYISVKCQTVSQGLSLLEATSEKKIFFGQINSIVLGEEMAREGILNTVDYLVRSDELRFDIPIVVSKGLTAEEVIGNGSSEASHVSQRIEKLLEVVYSTSASGKVEMSKVVNMLEDPFRAVYLPYVQVKDETKELVLGGYCIFDGQKLLTFLNEDFSRGINFLNNKVNNWVFILAPDDKNVSLKLSKVKSKTELKDGVFNVNIDFDTEIIQADSTIEEFNSSLAQKIIEMQNEKIKTLVEKTITMLKECACDAGAFGSAFENASPKEAQKYTKNWQEIFTKIKFSVKVTSELDPSKTAGKPVNQGGE